MTGIRIAILAAGEKGRTFVAAMLDDPGADVIGIATYEQVGSLDDSASNIGLLGHAHGVDVEFDRRQALDVAEDAELIFVVGWQFLLAPDPRIVVFHDSLLPRYRGFAPTVTALINGDPEVGVTALRPVDVPDAGPILAQHRQPVRYPARVRDVLERLTDSYIACAREVLHGVATGTLVELPQDHNSATYSIWRDDLDYLIDWSLDAERICRTVDALGWPYRGARTLLGGAPITIVAAEPVPELRFEITHAGKIWSLVDGRPTVVCGRGGVLVTDARDERGEPVSFDRVRVRLG